MSQCPDREILLRFYDGECTDQERLRWKPHIEECPFCHRVLTDQERIWLPSRLEQETPPGEPALHSRLATQAAGLSDPRRDTKAADRRRGISIGRGMQIAAGFLLVAGLGWGGAAVWRSSPVSGEEEIRFTQGKLGGRTVLRSQGDVSLAWNEGTVWRRRETGPLELETGFLSVSVPPGGGVEIHTPAGQVRNLGTVFSVQAFEYVPYGSTRPLAITVTVVREGTVEIRTEDDDRTVWAEMAGCLIRGFGPLLLDRSALEGGTMEELLGRLERADGANPVQTRLLEALLLVRGTRSPEEWRGLKGRADLPARLHKPLAWLEVQMNGLQ